MKKGLSTERKVASRDVVGMKKGLIDREVASRTPRGIVPIRPSTIHNVNLLS